MQIYEISTDVQLVFSVYCPSFWGNTCLFAAEYASYSLANSFILVVVGSTDLRI